MAAKAPAKMTAQAAPAPADDDDQDAAGAGAADTGADADQEENQEPSEIAMLVCYPDGQYGIEPAGGDEDEDEQGGDQDEGTEPEKFGSIGELLKGVMETVKTYEANKGSSSGPSDQDQFAAGYNGEAGAMS